MGDEGNESMQTLSFKIETILENQRENSVRWVKVEETLHKLDKVQATQGEINKSFSSKITWLWSVFVASLIGVFTTLLRK